MGRTGQVGRADVGDDPIVRRPSLLRRLQLRWAYHANVRSGKEPYASVRLRNLGELLFILSERKWPGGLKNWPDQLINAVRWFTNNRYEVSEAIADLRAVILRGVNLIY